MKPAKAEPEIATLDEVIETLKRVPKARLRIVRDVAEAFAESRAKSTRTPQRKSTKKKGLLDTPFCGMWADRTDIVDSQSFARTLRQRLETRGDRGTNSR
jgi:hypothetical protein